MAAYAYTATVHQVSHKALPGFPGMKVVSGTVDITNYNQTRAEITAITSKFRGNYTVVVTPSGTGAKPNIPSWDSTAKSIGLTVGSTGAELASDQVGGVFDFIAIGS